MSKQRDEINTDIDKEFENESMDEYDDNYDINDVYGENKGNFEPCPDPTGPPVPYNDTEFHDRMRGFVKNYTAPYDPNKILIETY